MSNANPSSVQNLGTLRCTNLFCTPHVSSPGNKITVFLELEGLPKDQGILLIGLVPLQTGSSGPLVSASVNFRKVKTVTLTIPPNAREGEYELQVKLADLLLASITHDVANEQASKEASMLDSARRLSLRAMDASSGKDFDGALRLARQAAQQYRDVSHVELACLTLQDIGAALLDHKQFDLAIDALEDASEGFEAIGDVKRHASTLFLLGRGLAMKEQTSAARQYLDRACVLGDEIGFDVLVLKSLEVLARHIDTEKYLSQFLHVALHSKSEIMRSEALLLCRNFHFDQQQSKIARTILHRKVLGQEEYKGKFTAGALSAKKRHRKLLPDPRLSEQLPWMTTLTVHNAALLTIIVSSLCSALAEKFNPEQQIVISTSRDAFKEMFTVGFGKTHLSSQTAKFISSWISKGNDFQFYYELAKAFGISIEKVPSSQTDKISYYLKIESTSDYKT
jgi:hypothetical protein